MMKSAFAAAALLAIVSGAAVAQEAPAANAEDCLKAAFEIAQAAEGKNLANDQLDKIEEMLTRMESHCDAKQFTEAAAVATDLKSMMSKQ
jgi:Skp family chaperone for outer membrane proteins